MKNIVYIVILLVAIFAVYFVAAAAVRKGWKFGGKSSGG